MANRYYFIKSVNTNRYNILLHKIYEQNNKMEILAKSKTNDYTD